MNEVEYLNMKNYGDQGGCYQPITPFEISIILHMIRKQNSIIVLLFIQNNSQFKNIAKTCLPPSMLSSSSIVHIQGCSAPQIFSKQQMLPFKLSSCCSCHVFSYMYYFTQFLLSKRVKFFVNFFFLCVCVCVCCIINFYCILQEEYPIKLWEKKCPPFLFSQLKTTQPCSRVFSVNGALTCKEAALLTSSVDQYR